MHHRSRGRLPALLCGLTLIILLSSAGLPAEDASETKPEQAEPGQGKPDQAEPERAAASEPPKTHKVSPQRLKIEVELKGTFESEKMSAVALRPETWSTLIVKQAVEHGKTVNQGEPLVWLETEKLDEAITTAEHGVNAAVVSLKQSEADLRVAEETLPIDLRSIELAKLIADENLLDYIKVDRERSVTSAKRSLDSSRFSLEYAQEELNQLKKMYEADDLTEETEEIILKRTERSVDSSKYALESAEVRTARRLDRDIPRTEQRLIDAAKRQEYELWRARVSLPANLEAKRLAVEKQRIDLKVAKNKLADLKKDRQAMIITAPAEGIVYYGRCVRGKWLDKTKADGMLVPGGTLTAKQTFITIVSRRPLDVRVALAEANLSDVQQGLAGIATPNGFADLQIPVKVDRISYIPLSEGIYDCLLSVTEDAEIGHVMPGMMCKIQLVTYDKPNVLTVPPAAVQQDDDDGKSFVYLVSGDKPVRRDVVTGKRNDKAVEIITGLEAGDEVMLDKPK